MPTSQSPLPTPKYLQEDDLTQECKDLISSLPTEKGWVATHLHQYQGFWHTARQLQGVIACQKHFQAHDTDVLLVTTPKSGTTWLKALAYAIVNRARYPIAQNHHPLLTANPHELVPFLELKLFVEKMVPNPDLTNFMADPVRLFATHLPLVSMPGSVKGSQCKLVYLCRNPRDTFISLWHFTNKLRPLENGTNSLEEVFDQFCRGVSLFGPFWDHVLAYWKESLERPSRVLFLKYEELKEEPSEHLRRLAEFLGCPFSKEEEEEEGVLDDIIKLCSFDSLSNLEVNKTGKLASGEENSAFFRQGEVGDSMNYLTAEMMNRLDQVTEEKLNGSELKF